MRLLQNLAIDSFNCFMMKHKFRTVTTKSWKTYVFENTHEKSPLRRFAIEYLYQTLTGKRPRLFCDASNDPSGSVVGVIHSLVQGISDLSKDLLNIVRENHVTQQTNNHIRNATTDTSKPWLGPPCHFHAHSNQKILDCPMNLIAPGEASSLTDHCIQYHPLNRLLQGDKTHYREQIAIDIRVSSTERIAWLNLERVAATKLVSWVFNMISFKVNTPSKYLGWFNRSSASFFWFVGMLRGLLWCPRVIQGGEIV